MVDVAHSPSVLTAVPDLLRQSYGPLKYATLIATLAVLFLGAYVGYQAYRGYKRNDNRPVLFLGMGLFLVTTVRQLASVLTVLTVGEDPLLGLLVFFGLSITGLLSILFAFLWA